MMKHPLTAMMLVICAALSLSIGCRHLGAADPADTPPDAADLALMPLDARLPGVPPVSGVRNWQTPFRPIDAEGSYLSVVHRDDGMVELWQNSWDVAGTAETRQLQVRRGRSLETLGAPESVCDGTIISDVFDPASPASPAPKRGMTRICVTRDSEIGYVALVCVCPDYLPGSVSLLPALLISATGETGSWTYLGMLPGEPAAEAAKRKIWSDGGSIVRLADGRWRIYLNGFGGRTMTAVESASIHGPWTFLRDRDGAIRELLPDFPREQKRGGCFPQILRVDEQNWHGWIIDKWPPQCVFHFWSPDGLAWTLFGEQPEVTRTAFNSRPIKCLRPFLMPGGKQIGCLLSVWETIGDRKLWRPRLSEMPSAGMEGQAE